ncbi:MAG TPA: hypothetical protein VGB64_03755 [Actinomycetota bacterium]
MKFIDPATRQERENAPWLQLDHEYPVLAIDVLPDKRVLFRIESADDGTPALFDAEMFVTTSTEIPGNWRARVEEGGSLQLAPEPWLRLGFWDDFFDRKPEALETYERERAVILRDKG